MGGGEEEKSEWPRRGLQVELKKLFCASWVSKAAVQLGMVQY